MKVTLLGTGTPAPNPRRFQSAVLVQVGDESLLFDAGRGAVHQLARTGCDLARVGPVFITHHHVDHISDLFDVIITTALCGRRSALEIVGPPGTRGIVRGLLDHVYARDIRSRRAEERAQRAAGFDVPDQAEIIGRVECRECAGGVAGRTRAWRVTAEPVRHGDYADEDDLGWCCLGYRVEAGGKIVAISGDTVHCDEAVRLAADADLLVQCCHFPDAAVTNDAMRHLTRHTLPTAGQAGRIAAEAGVGRLVLTHISASVVEVEQLVRDARRVFDGPVTVGEDLLAFDV